MWSEETVLAALAYQTHGEGWRLGTGADVDLHIQLRASGACVHRCVCVYVCERGEKSNGCLECERGKGGAAADGVEWNEGGITITGRAPIHPT